MGYITPFHYPRMADKKPRWWWWGTLACVSYLMPLHTMAMFAQGAHQSLSATFSLAANCHDGLLLRVYVFVVRRKTTPHFFQFYVLMAMLPENAAQISGTVFSWMPFWRHLDVGRLGYCLLWLALRRWFCAYMMLPLGECIKRLCMHIYNRSVPKGVQTY